jgi:hypothetical protein
MIALAGTVVSNPLFLAFFSLMWFVQVSAALEEWATGTRVQKQFVVDEYRDEYSNHLLVLEDAEKDKKATYPSSTAIHASFQ